MLERTRDALAHVKAQGAVLGSSPLGLRRAEMRDDAGRLVVEHDAEEHATVERVRELAAEGRTLRTIASQLTAEGRRTKRGGRWHASTVRAVLARTGETKAA